MDQKSIVDPSGRPISIRAESPFRKFRSAWMLLTAVLAVAAVVLGNISTIKKSIQEIFEPRAKPAIVASTFPEDNFLELQVRNPSDAPAFITEAEIEVVACYDFIATWAAPGAYVPISKTYNATIPIKRAPYSVRIAMSQEVPPKGVDAFSLCLHEGDHGDRYTRPDNIDDGIKEGVLLGIEPILQLKVRLKYNRNESMEVGPLLWAFSGGVVLFRIPAPLLHKLNSSNEVPAGFVEAASVATKHNTETAKALMRMNLPKNEGAGAIMDSLLKPDEDDARWAKAIEDVAE